VKRFPGRRNDGGGPNRGSPRSASAEAKQPPCVDQHFERGVLPVQHRPRQVRAKFTVDDALGSTLTSCSTSGSCTCATPTAPASPTLSPLPSMQCGLEKISNAVSTSAAALPRNHPNVPARRPGERRYGLSSRRRSLRERDRLADLYRCGACPKTDVVEASGPRTRRTRVPLAVKAGACEATGHPCEHLAVSARAGGDGAEVALLGDEPSPGRTVTIEGRLGPPPAQAVARARRRRGSDQPAHGK
jgi:hypothetical protein